MFAEPLGARSRSTGDFCAESQQGGAAGGASTPGGYLTSQQEGTLQLMQSPQVSTVRCCRPSSLPCPAAQTLLSCSASVWAGAPACLPCRPVG